MCPIVFVHCQYTTTLYYTANTQYGTLLIQNTVDMIDIQNTYRYTRDKHLYCIRNLTKYHHEVCVLFRLGQKEDYMFCMDEFFERELPNMYHYIEKISVSEQ